MIDLHQHSVFSDGTDDIDALVQKNIDAGMNVFALTDHDNVQGCKTLVQKYAKGKTDCRFVTGVEFSANDQGKRVHILAYDYDIDNPTVQNLLDKGQRLRKERMELVMQHVKDNFGIEFSKEDLAKIRQSANPGKPMLAQCLIQSGYGTTIKQTIEKYLNVYFLHKKLSAQEVIESFRDGGAITVLAHPLGGVGEKRVDFDTLQQRLDRFVSYGLKGLECYYSMYDNQEQNALVRLAKEHNLAISAGSDYHGKNKEVILGDLGVEHPVVLDEKITVCALFQRWHKI